MSLLKVNEIQIFNGENVTITAPAVITANDNTNAALRITQTGTGNALVVEDSTNPDSTPVVVDDLGLVIKGHTSTINHNVNNGTFTQVAIQTHGLDGNSASNAITSWDGGPFGATLIMSRSKSESIGTHSIVSSGDNLASISFNGSDGSKFVSAAEIQARIDGTPGTNDMPGRLVFSTTADGSSSPTERMRIDSAGNVGIGTTSPAAPLHVNQTTAIGSTSGSLSVGQRTEFELDTNQRIFTISAIRKADKSPTNSWLNTAIRLESNIDDVSNTKTWIELGNTTATNANFISFGVAENTERMRIDSSGNVGIGTASPAQKLDVDGNINATGALTLGTALAIAEGGTGATDAATARTNLDVDQAGTDNSTDCTLVTTSHDYLSIAGQAITLGPIDLAADVTGTLPVSNGGTGVPSLGSLDAADLGSGTATDGYVLTADGAGNAAWEAASGGGAASLPIDLLSSGASIRKSDGTTAVLSESGGTVTLENASLGDTVLMPDNSNNVSTAPGIRFEADTDTGIGLASAGNLAVVTGGTEHMRIDSSGKVNIGDVPSLDAAQNLSAQGNVLATTFGGSFGHINIATNCGSYTNTYGHLWFYNGNGLVGSIATTGSSTAYNTSSDYRLKENVTLVTDGITRLQQLRPSRFNFIADPTKTVDGFLAHEAAEVVPEAITGEKDAVDADGNPEYQGIDQSKLVPLLTAALQEAIAKIDALETRIQALEV